LAPPLLHPASRPPHSLPSSAQVINSGAAALASCHIAASHPSRSPPCCLLPPLLPSTPRAGKHRRRGCLSIRVEHHHSERVAGHPPASVTSPRRQACTPLPSEHAAPPSTCVGRTTRSWAGRPDSHGSCRLGYVLHASVEWAVPTLCGQAVSRAAAGNWPNGLFIVFPIFD
jgi:hypothetical protein